jgi:hypothetical protein
MSILDFYRIVEHKLSICTRWSWLDDNESLNLNLKLFCIKKFLEFFFGW